MTRLNWILRISSIKITFKLKKEFIIWKKSFKWLILHQLIINLSKLERNNVR
jgi:hypothetical protein